MQCSTEPLTFLQHEDAMTAATLSHALSLVGYKTRIQQLAFVKLMAYRDCFSRLPIPSVESKEITTPQRQRIDRAESARKTANLKDSYPHHKDSIIDDSEASFLLNTNFKSLNDAFEWLLNITQAKFLRESFDFEGIGKDREKTGVNLVRYNPKDEISVEDLEHKYDRQGKEYHLYQLIKMLGLIDEFSFPKEQDIKHIVIHACIEKFAKERIAYLESIFQKLNGKEQSGEVVIYYPTNPRGAFNDETALADCITKQFGDLKLKPKIQQVLDLHKDSKDSKTWTRDLTGLKKEILEAVGKTEWPTFPESFYYRNAEAYDVKAKIDGRESLRDFPVGTDIINYHICKLMEKYPNAAKKIKVVEIIGSGKDGKIANTKDLIQAWYEVSGKTIFSRCGHGEILPVAFVSDNTMHAILNQDTVVKNIFHGIKNIEVITVGPGARKFSVAMALDGLTKTIFSIAPEVKENIAKTMEACAKKSKAFSKLPFIAVGGLFAVTAMKIFGHIINEGIRPRP